MSAIIINLPTSISKLEVKEELRKSKFLVKSVLRLNNEDKTLTTLMAKQLVNNPLLQDIFQLNKLFNCIIITESYRKPKDTLQCTTVRDMVIFINRANSSLAVYNVIIHTTTQIRHKTSSIPFTCVNCNETHLANYKCCTYFKIIKTLVVSCNITLSFS